MQLTEDPPDRLKNEKHSCMNCGTENIFPYIFLEKKLFEIF